MVAPAKKPEWDFVEAVWLDSAASQNSGWHSLEEIPNIVTMVTRGWLIRKLPDEIVLAGTYYDNEGTWTFGEFISIPRCALKHPLKKLKV